jgi:hypothetical protein
MVAVMGDVSALVYNFHEPLSSKVKLSIQRGWLLCNLGFYLLACWSGGYFLILWCYVYSCFFSIGVYLLFLRRGVVCLGCGGVLACSVPLCVVSFRGCAVIDLSQLFH